MPKSSRKRKDKVADFSKAKLKLGKGKRLPANVVDTSFKARTIALPAQSIAVEKAEPTNKRGQSLDDVLSLLKHYSAGTRKDAVFSARELFQDHPALLPRSTAPLLNACVRLIGDDDAAVRRALLSFFDWLLPRLDKRVLIPHIPMLLLLVASAQTHIFPEIRIDAVRFLDLLLDVAPGNVVGGWDGSGLGHGKRVLEGYLGILGIRTMFGGQQGTAQSTSATSVVLSPQSKFVVLHSLSSFLGYAVDPLASSESHKERTTAVPTWFLRPCFATNRLYEEHANVFQSSLSGKHISWKIHPDFDSFDEDFTYDPRLLSSGPDAAWDLGHLLDLSSELDNAQSGTVHLIMRLSRTLHPTLTAVFLDSAPVVFSPSVNPPEIQVQTLMAAFKIARTLYSAVLQHVFSGPELAVACEELRTLLDYLTKYFPFTPAHREVKVEQAFQDLNVIYCELASLLVLVSHPSGTRDVWGGNRFGASRSRMTPSAKTHFSTDAQADLVKTYVIGLLEGNGGSSAQLPRPITAALYTSLLPTIWALLNRRDKNDREAERSSVLAAILDHGIRTPSGSTVKRPTIEFVGRLLLLEKQSGYTGYFNPRDVPQGHKFQDWLIHLPKTLWEMGANNLETTEMIFGVLLRLVQRGSWVMQHEQISLLSSRLTPFFVMMHPTRGRVPGPFARIPCAASHIRCLALDLCASLVIGRTDDELHNAVSEAVKGTREEPYWEGVTRAMQSGDDTGI